MPRVHNDLIQVEELFNKVGFDPNANAQARRAATVEDESGGGSSGGGGLPRMDINTMLAKVPCMLAWTAFPQGGLGVFGKL